MLAVIKQNVKLTFEQSDGYIFIEWNAYILQVKGKFNTQDKGHDVVRFQSTDLHVLPPSYIGSTNLVASPSIAIDDVASIHFNNNNCQKLKIAV